MSITSVRLKPEIAKPLKDLAKKLDRSKSYLINEAVAEYLLKQDQDQQRWDQTLAAINSIKEGQSIDGEAVNQWLESWGGENELKPPKE